MPAKVNDKLKDKVIQKEGFVKNGLPYKDIGGTITIGYGFTKNSLDGLNGRPLWSDYWDEDGNPTGKTMSKEEADAILDSVLQPYVDQVNTYIKNDTLSEDQFNGVVDLFYRNGAGNVLDSGIVPLINDGKFKEASDLIKKGGNDGKLIKSGGTVLKEGDEGYKGIQNRNTEVANVFEGIARPEGMPAAKDLTELIESELEPARQDKTLVEKPVEVEAQERFQIQQDEQDRQDIVDAKEEQEGQEIIEKLIQKQKDQEKPSVEGDTKTLLKNLPDIDFEEEEPVDVPVTPKKEEVTTANANADTEDETEPVDNRAVVKTGPLDAIGGIGTVVSALVGARALSKASEDPEILDTPELSDAFQAELYQAEQLSKQGFSPDQERQVRDNIQKSYDMGVENAIRGTAGDRAKFLAMSGVLDAKRQSALLDFAAKDEAARQANKQQYTQMLQFKETYDRQNDMLKRTESMQRAQAEQQTASALGAAALKTAMDNINNAKADQMQRQYIASLTDSNKVRTEKVGLLESLGLGKLQNMFKKDTE